MNADHGVENNEDRRVIAILEGDNLRGWNKYCKESELLFNDVHGYLICGEFNDTIKGFHRLYETIVDEVDALNDGTVSHAVAKFMTSSRLINFMEGEVPVVKEQIARRIGVHSISLLPRENGEERPGNFVGHLSNADLSHTQRSALGTVGVYISQFTNIGREIERLIDLTGGESVSRRQIFECMEDSENIGIRVDEFLCDSSYEN